MIIKKGILAFAIAWAIMAAGCQQEVDQLIEPPTGQVFTNQSDVAAIIQRVVMNDGSIDNVVDGSSCSSLQLPVTVTVNGQEITLNSASDFNTVENIIDRYGDDDDEIEFDFPITVVLADYSTVTFTNEDQFEDFVDKCTEDSEDDDIECVDFKFPLSISIYNSDNQVADVVTVKDDEEMHDFIHDLNESEFAGFAFPITVILSDGTEIIISNNDDLEDVLENSIGDCDEDDDNDHNDDDADATDLLNTLTTGQWKISYFFNDEDETVNYTGYVLTFTNDGIVKVVKGGTTITASWSVDGDDGSLELDLDFGDDDLFEELTEDWDVLEYNLQTIKLTDDSEEYLSFARP